MRFPFGPATFGKSRQSQLKDLERLSSFVPSPLVLTEWAGLSPIIKFSYAPAALAYGRILTSLHQCCKENQRVVFPQRKLSAAIAEKALKMTYPEAYSLAVIGSIYLFCTPCRSNSSDGNLQST